MTDTIFNKSTLRMSSIFVNNIQPISYVSSPSGSGKTYKIVETANKSAQQGNKIIICQSTKNLIDDTAKHLASQFNHAPYKVFHSDTVPEGTSVAGELVRFFKNVPNGVGQIIFITHAALAFVPYIHNKADWHLIIDEELTVAVDDPYTIPRTHHIITDHIELEPFNAIYSVAKITNKEFVRNEDNDEIINYFSKTLRRLNNDNWQVYVNTEWYEKLRSGEGKTISFHCVLQPKLLDGFASVFMAAANLEDTLVYQLWGQQREFKEDIAFKRNLRKSPIKGDLITIHYCLEQSWSKKIRNGDANNVQDRIVSEIKNLFGDDKNFLWQANKDFDLEPFGNNAERLPNKPAGLNRYADYKNIGFLTTANPRSDHFQFLRTLGLAADAVRKGIYMQEGYQSIMRTAIRDPNNTEPISVLVPDRGMAEYLAQCWSGVKLEKIDIIDEDGIMWLPGRPKKHETNQIGDRERHATYRQRQKERQTTMMAELIIFRRNDVEKLGNLHVMENPNTIGFSVTEFFPNFTQGTIFATKYDISPTYINRSGENEFVEWLYHIWQDNNRTKDENYHISPAIFDGNGRKHENIMFLRHLWFDFEDGDLKPEELPKLFPNIQMLVTNTYNHTKDKPRFRVIIPTTQAVTPEAYKALYDQFRLKLKDAGYHTNRRKDNYQSTKTKLRSGLDWVRSAPTSLFNLPSQAADKTQSFFNFYDNDGRQLLDPTLWIRNAVTVPEYVQKDVSDDIPEDTIPTIDEAKLHQAESDWLSACTKGKTNEALFDYSAQLKQAGLSLSDVEMKLKQGIAMVPTKSRKDRLRQIPDIINWHKDKPLTYRPRKAKTNVKTNYDDMFANTTIPEHWKTTED